MKNILHRFGKFYSSVMINFIGIFIFVGLLSVICGEYGWMPNEDIYAISQFVYSSVIPVMIAYASGNRMRQLHKKEGMDEFHAGGVIAVMAEAGVVLAGQESSILGALLLGPFCGFLWENILKPAVKKCSTGMEMLVRNIVVACAGGVMAVVAFYFITPVIVLGTNILLFGMNWLVEHNMLWFLSIIIEPAKVFFLNNSIHLGILLPLGLQQAEQAGESVLFLLETNPGPGFGVLLALYLYNKKRRKEYLACMFAEGIGGIHEVYFPEVLSNIWLVPALICGGMTGTICFSLLQVATTGAVSPGSIITVLFMSGRHHVLGALVGVLLSALVSAIVACGILRMQTKQRRRKKAEAAEAAMLEQEKKENIEADVLEQKRACDIETLEQEEEKALQWENEAAAGEEALLEQNKVSPKWDSQGERKLEEKIGFICDAGVGSSAMGAALFRKKLKEMGITGVEVGAYAMDQIPSDLTVAVCQKDFKEILLSEAELTHIYTVESLLNQSEHSAIIEQLLAGQHNSTEDD